MRLYRGRPVRRDFLNSTGGPLIDQLGREAARPILREYYASDRGREKLRELHEILQKAGA